MEDNPVDRTAPTMEEPGLDFPTTSTSENDPFLSVPLAPRPKEVSSTGATTPTTAKPDFSSQDRDSVDYPPHAVLPPHRPVLDHPFSPISLTITGPGFGPLVTPASYHNPHLPVYEPTAAPVLPYIVHKGDNPKTVTETVSITTSEFFVSFVTESHLYTVTDTVFINKTVNNFITVTHTNYLIHTINNTLPQITVSATTTPSTPTAAPLAQATFIPASSSQQADGGLKPVAVAFIVLGAVAGLLMLIGMAWFAVRKYRAWKAKENHHMRGVELQRKWEVEQEDGRMKREMGGFNGGDGV